MENAVFGAIVALVSILVTVRIHRIGRFNRAANEFTSAFIAAIQLLRSDDYSDTYILERHFPVHERAKEIFIRNLGGAAKRGFCRAWDEYERHCAQRTGDEARLQHIAATYKNGAYVDTNSLNAHVLSLIEKLLIFAVPKNI